MYAAGWLQMPTIKHEFFIGCGSDKANETAEISSTIRDDGNRGKRQRWMALQKFLAVL